MPWEVTDPMRERAKFVVDVWSGLYTIMELAEWYGVSSTNGSTDMKPRGLSGLEDRSRAPGSCPHQTPAEIVVYRKALGAGFRTPEEHRSAADNKYDHGNDAIWESWHLDQSTRFTCAEPPPGTPMRKPVKRHFSSTWKRRRAAPSGAASS